MNRLARRPSPRSRCIAAALVLTAAGSAACGSGASAVPEVAPEPSVAAPRLAPRQDVPCATTADTVERRAAAGAAMPACVLMELVRLHTWARDHDCAVTADAAERRALRHPGNVCRV